MPACEQSSSFPGVPETPTAPTISSPTLIGRAPRTATIGLEVAALRRAKACAVVAEHDERQSLSIDNRNRDFVSHAPALGDCRVGDGLCQRQSYVLLCHNALCAGWRCEDGGEGETRNTLRNRRHEVNPRDSLGT